MKEIYKKSEFIGKGNNLSVVERDFEGGGEIHLHDYYELEMVLEGDGEQNLNGTTYPLKKGTVYLITPIDFHCITSLKGMKIINISFDEALLSAEWRMHFVNRRNDLIFNSEEKFEYLSKLFYAMKEECESDNAYSTKACNHLLELLFISIFRKTQNAKSEASVTVKPYMQYIFQHFRDELTLSQIAALSGYTPHYFSTLFHSETGRCFTDFLNELRINYAKMLLNTTNLSITEICEKSGFGSQSNFFRIFNLSQGCSPKAYRQNGKYYYIEK